MTTHRQARTQGGMSLIEVLVSLLIFSFGLLGLFALQARAVQYSVSAEDTGRASILASELVAEMRIKNTINLPSTTVEAWQERVKTATGAGLPNGNGTVVINGGAAEITITWVPTRAASTAANVNRYVTQVVL